MWWNFFPWVMLNKSVLMKMYRLYDLKLKVRRAVLLGQQNPIFRRNLPYMILWSDWNKTWYVRVFEDSDSDDMILFWLRSFQGLKSRVEKKVKRWIWVNGGFWGRLVNIRVGVRPWLYTKWLILRDEGVWGVFKVSEYVGRVSFTPCLL